MPCSLCIGSTVFSISSPPPRPTVRTQRVWWHLANLVEEFMAASATAFTMTLTSASNSSLAVGEEDTWRCCLQQSCWIHRWCWSRGGSSGYACALFIFSIALFIISLLCLYKVTIWNRGSDSEEYTYAHGDVMPLRLRPNTAKERWKRILNITM